MSKATSGGDRAAHFRAVAALCCRLAVLHGDRKSNAECIPQASCPSPDAGASARSAERMVLLAAELNRAL
jgi:hypothetical protein